MTKEEMIEIFEFLEKEFNKYDLFYFKYEDRNNIGAYYKNNNQRFAQFYIKPILEVIKSGEREK